MPTPPNVIVIMVDQLRATALGLYGNPQVRTPHLEALAESGICFDQAHAACPVCVPSRVALWSGRWPHLSGARTNGILMPEHEEHLLQPLKEAGYRTALFGKNHCFTRQQLGQWWDVVSEVSHGGPLADRGDAQIAAARAWTRHPDQNRAAYAAAVSPFPVEKHGTWLIADDTVRFLQEHAAAGSRQPFAAWVSIADPHTPYQVSEPCASRYPPESIILPPRRSAAETAARTEREQVFSHLLGADEVTDEQLRFVTSIYYGMIAVIDDAVGRILSTLEALGLRDDTLVVFLSDHGDYMGERQMVRKTIALHDALTRVPLLLSWPGHVAAGQRIASPVSLLDVLPTLTKLLGLRPLPGRSGQSLPPWGPARQEVYAEHGTEEPTPTWERVRTGKLGTSAGQSLPWQGGGGRMKMVRNADWKYIYEPNAGCELYDLRQDPHELCNLAQRPEHAARVTAFQQQLLDWTITTETTLPALGKSSE